MLSGWRFLCVSHQSQFQLLNKTSLLSRYIHTERRARQIYDHFLILDFEATCLKDKKISPQEIVEFPCLKINSETYEVESIFHNYIKPMVHTSLPPFCTELTGIMQEMVDDEPSFDIVLSQFENWLVKENLIHEIALGKSIFVTSGDWDLQVMLPDQCQLLNIPVPQAMTSWINIKKSYAKATGYFPRGILDMLSRLNLSHVGRLHSGIDDCRNILLILKELGDKGFKFQQTGTLTIFLP